MSNKTNFFILILITILAISCSSNEITSPVQTELPRRLERTEEQLLNSSQLFGINIFKRIAEAQSDSNVFISPLSISTALSMALNGARGETYNEMLSTLDMNGLSIEEINSASQSLRALLTTLDPKVIFTIANSVWYRENLTFQADFLQRMTEYYSAQIEGRDFSNPAIVDEVNNWVKANTNEMIEKVINEIDPAVVMFLINALYFNGTWQKEFNQENTIDYMFLTSEGNQVDCEMMVQDETYKYFETDQFQAVDLPYGDVHYSMSVFLPKSNYDLSALYAELTSDNWSSWINRFSEREIRLLMPKFESEYGLELKDILIAMGMRTAFTGSADFTRLFAPGGIFISSVLHKTAIKVNEEGTEAAAVTVITFERTSAGDENLVMQMDRPFLYVIRENSTGTILFIGQMVNPVL